jgi:2-polyprenyl-3-methyl-5-hydroxy-6-metoxy-1,4-benzoquinol methylase
MASQASFASATFRDPAGSLRIVGDRVLRTVHRDFAEDCLSFLRSSVAQAWIASGRLIDTRVIEQAPGEELELEHERVFFASYPWEWTPGQWTSAAELTLDFAELQLAIGRILKDATPLNVLFQGPKPVFVDVLSSEVRDLESPLWLAYGQFVRTFLLPLAACKYLGWPLASSLMRRDGYQPSDLYPHLSTLERCWGPLFRMVTMPHLLEKINSVPSSRQLRQRPELAASLHRRRLRSLRKTLHSVAPRPTESRWSEYSQTADHYAAADRAQKREFLERVLSRVRPKNVLDIGANTGVYSRVAAEFGARVVVWDTDVAASERNWQSAVAANLPILPLVADVARPTPALGWRNAESASLLERARGRFDCVMMLGVIHHLLLAEQIPLDEIVRLTAELATRWAIVEWVPPSDPRFIDLCRGRDAIYSHLNERAFLNCFAQEFSPALRKQLSNGRVLFFLVRNS